MAAITLLMLAINLGGDQIPWSSPVIPILLLATIFVASLFFRHESRTPSPVLPLRLVRSRHMAVQVMYNLLAPLVVFGVSPPPPFQVSPHTQTLFSIPIYFQTVHLTTASTASRRLLYPTLTAPLASLATGWIYHHHPNSKRHGQRLGAVLLFIGTLTMWRMTYETRPHTEVGWAVRLIGVHAGMGVLFISTLLDVLAIVGSGESSRRRVLVRSKLTTDHAAATSLIFLLRSLGTVLGVAGAQAILQNVLLTHLQAALTDPAVRRTSDTSDEAAGGNSTDAVADQKHSRVGGLPPSAR